MIIKHAHSVERLCAQADTVVHTGVIPRSARQLLYQIGSTTVSQTPGDCLPSQQLHFRQIACDPHTLLAPFSVSLSAAQCGLAGSVPHVKVPCSSILARTCMPCTHTAQCHLPGLLTTSPLPCRLLSEATGGTTSYQHQDRPNTQPFITGKQLTALGKVSRQVCHFLQRVPLVGPHPIHPLLLIPR